MWVSRAATSTWREGDWSNLVGWPETVAEDDGRLCWAGRSKLWMSVSDDFYSFDEEVEGDSAPINRTIGGRASDVQWLLSVGRLIVGTSMECRTVKSSSFDEPVTRDAISIRNVSDAGSAPVQARRVGTKGFFVDRDLIRPHIVAYDVDIRDYTTARLDFLAEQIFAGQVKDIAVQTRPHTRIYYLLNDGSLYALLYEPREQVQGFHKISAPDATFKAIGVEPTTTSSDNVWAEVEIGGERVIWRMFSEFDGYKHADDAVEYGSPGSATLTGLTHLNYMVPVGWVDGAPLSSTTPIENGSLTLSTAPTSAVIGRPYSARWKGVKAAYGAQGGTAVGKTKRIQGQSIHGVDIAIGGIRFGVATEENEYLRPLHEIINGQSVDPGTVHSQFDPELDAAPGDLATDPRLVLQNIAPYPATILNIKFSVETNE